MLTSCLSSISTTAAIKCHRNYLTNHMESKSHHITPLVIHSLGGGHTRTCANTHANPHAYRHSRTEAILRNQARAGYRPACAWFKNKNAGYNTRHACSACMDSQENSLRNPLKNSLYVLWPQPSTHMTISAVVM